MSETIRLQRYLSAAGVAARRKAEELIVQGLVRVNGKQVRLLGTKVDPRVDHITVDGQAIAMPDAFYVLFNKPKGCVAAVQDDRGRPTVMEYLPSLPIAVRPVGRLDFYSEGVLLLTNDGELAARLLSPQRAIQRTYHVKLRGELSAAHLAALRTGVRLADGTMSLPADVERLPGESRHTWVAVTVMQPSEHLVQNMFEALGYQVTKVQRVAFASLTFHGLRVGDARELTQAELNGLRDLVELDHRPIARGAWRSTREASDISRRARERAREEEAGESNASAQQPTGRSAAAAAPRPERGSPREATRDAARGPKGRPVAQTSSRARRSNAAPRPSAPRASGERPRAAGPGARSGERPRAAGPGARGGERPRAAGPGARSGERPRAAGPGARSGERPRAAGPGARSGERPRAAARPARPPRKR